MGLAPLGKPHEKLKNKNKSYIEIFRNIIKSGNGLNYSINTSSPSFIPKTFNDRWSPAVQELRDKL